MFNNLISNVNFANKELCNENVVKAPFVVAHNRLSLPASSRDNIVEIANQSDRNRSKVNNVSAKRASWPQRNDKSRKLNETGSMMKTSNPVQSRSNIIRSTNPTVNPPRYSTSRQLQVNKASNCSIEYDCQDANVSFSRQSNNTRPQVGSRSSQVQQIRQIRRSVSPLKRWGIKFDGTRSSLPVEEFLFRIESLALADGINPEILAVHVHQFLAEKALNWYWLYRRVARQFSWAEFRDALLAEFRSQETDYEIRQAMHHRIQRPHESFSDYRLAMESLASRLVSPMSREKLIAITRRNMHPRLRNALLLHDVSSMEELRDLARKFEKLWSETGTRSKPFNVSEVYPAYGASLFDKVYSVKDVDGINEANSNINEYEESDYNDNAKIDNRKRNGIKDPKQKFDSSLHNSTVDNGPVDVNDEVCVVEYPPALSRYICWNCDKKGHSFRDCPVERRSLFCYKCGRKGVTTPACQNCKSGNVLTNAVNSGSTRLKSRGPEKKAGET